jgi:hypothetical protein
MKYLTIAYNNGECESKYECFSALSALTHLQEAVDRGVESAVILAEDGAGYREVTKIWLRNPIVGGVK